LQQRQTFKKLCELTMMKSSLEKRIEEMDEINISEEIVLVKVNKDIEKLQTYLRKELYS